MIITWMSSQHYLFVYLWEVLVISAKPSAVPLMGNTSWSPFLREYIACQKCGCVPLEST